MLQRKLLDGQYYLGDRTRLEQLGLVQRDAGRPAHVDFGQQVRRVPEQLEAPVALTTSASTERAIIPAPWTAAPVAARGMVAPSTGARAALVVLVLYGLLPIVRSTIVGVTGIDRSVREVGVAMGMTPSEVIVAATRDSADIAKVNTGLVAPGRNADFIVLDANPLDNIANTRKINKVYLRGTEVDRAALRTRWQAQLKAQRPLS